MPAQRLKGKPVVEQVLADVKRRVEKLRSSGVIPGLGTIIVGDDPASAGYVRKKHETCAEVGIASFNEEIPSQARQTDLLAAVDRLNQNPGVDGFLIQHPVPAGFDFNEALRRMDADKDADGLHPINLGKLVLQESGPVPCTPAGIQAMLIHYDIPVEGREVVIVGRGTTLGRPLALLLSMKQAGANAAVTVVHSRVPNLADYTRRADIVICAVGIPGFLKPDMIQPGSVVINGGISWDGPKLLPDVDEACAEVAGQMTSRLGGVGPTTVAMLMRNTVEAAERRASRSG